MSAEDLFIEGNELHVDEDYTAADACYCKALALDGKDVKVFLARGANYIKMKRYQDAIADADSALALQPTGASLSIAHLRKGVGLFYLDRFEEAKAALEKAAVHNGRATEMWLRKTNAELVRLGKMEPEQPPRASAPVPKETTPTATSATTTTTTTAAAKATMAAATTTPSSSSPSPSAPPGTATPSVRESWFQGRSTVTISLFIKNLTSDNVKVSMLDARMVHVLLKIPTSGSSGSSFSPWERTWSLFDETAPMQDGRDLDVQVNPYKVEITMNKMTPDLTWAALEGTAFTTPSNTAPSPSSFDLSSSSSSSSFVPSAPPSATPSVAPSTSSRLLRANVISEGKKATPYAPSTSKKDWDALEAQLKKDEAEDKGEGPDALNKLFQQIYANGTDETKRAMMKSYATSGGTVLSTNWGEVKEKDYEKEITPPAGMEVRKF